MPKQISKGKRKKPVKNINIVKNQVEIINAVKRVDNIINEKRSDVPKNVKLNFILYE